MVPMMLSAGQARVIEAGTATPVWVDRSGSSGVRAVATAERAHQPTVERRLCGPTGQWTAGELTRSYAGSADGERRYREEADVLAQHGYQGWLETSTTGDPLGARILLARQLVQADGRPATRGSIRRTVTWTKATTT